MKQSILHHLLSLRVSSTLERRNTSRLYWTLQIIGWSSFSLLCYISFWPYLTTRAAHWSEALKLVGAFVLTFLLRPAVRWIWAKCDLLTAITLCISISACLGLLVESVGQFVVHIAFGSPHQVHFWTVMQSSFLTQAAFASWCAAYFLYKSFLRRQQEETRLHEAEIRLKEAQITSFRHQIPQRFFVGTLLGIDRMIGTAGKTDTSIMIARVGMLLRSILDHPSEEYATLTSELGQAKEYLDIQNRLLGESIQLRVDDAEAVRSKFLVPRWLLIPLLEETRLLLGCSAETSYQWHLRITSSGHELLIELITDISDLDGMNLSKAPAFGLTRERLDMIYGPTACVDTKWVTGALRVKLTLPEEHTGGASKVSPSENLILLHDDDFRIEAT